MLRVIDPKFGETVYDPGCGRADFWRNRSST